MILLNGVFAGCLNVFHTDVLQAGARMGGLFLTVFPICSKGVDAITNIIVGQLIERTRTRLERRVPG